MVTRGQTILALLTPPGVGGVASIGLWGENAWEVVRPLFRPRNPAADPGAEPLLVGTIGGPGDRPGDDVVLAMRRQGNVQQVEIHCHGGVAANSWLCRLLAARGAVELSWQDWLRCTLPDPIQAEAQIALARAATPRTAGILLDQWHGAWQRGRAEHAHLLAKDAEAARALARRWTGWISLGERLTQPWKVALAGVPNVGKSSLLNALLGYPRAIVSPLPGTTRDVVTAVTAFEGWPVELQDTAGWCNQANGIEEAGIARARRAAAEADLCVWVVDASAPSCWPEELDPSRVLLAVNKIDLLGAGPVPPMPDVWGTPTFVSAVTHEGIDALIAAVVSRLVPDPPPAGAPVPFTPELAEEARRLAGSGFADKSPAPREKP